MSDSRWIEVQELTEEEQIQMRVDHFPNVHLVCEEFGIYADGKGTPEFRALLEKHMEACGFCRLCMNDIERERDWLKENGDAAPPVSG